MSVMEYNDILFDVQGLFIEYVLLGQQLVQVVYDVFFILCCGEFVGLVGEFGFGKFMFGFVLIWLQKLLVCISGGCILFDGCDICEFDVEELCCQCQGGFVMVLQFGMNVFNFVCMVGNYFCDIFVVYGYVLKEDCEVRVCEFVGKVGLKFEVLDCFLGEFFGGMCQCVLIVFVLLFELQFMVFDELIIVFDVFVQYVVMDMIQELQCFEYFIVIFISYDFGIVFEVIDWVMVMYEGCIVEDVLSWDILYCLQDEYMWMLLSYYVDLWVEKIEILGFIDFGIWCWEGCSRMDVIEMLLMVLQWDVCCVDVVIVVEGVLKCYLVLCCGQELVVVVDDVLFCLELGEVFVFVGVLGLGKLIIVKMFIGVEKFILGIICFGDIDVVMFKCCGLCDLCKDVQMVFQDLYVVLNLLYIVEYVFICFVVNYMWLCGVEVWVCVFELLEMVGFILVEQFVVKLLYQFFGGQWQCVVIVCVFVSDLQVFIVDELVLMFDVLFCVGVFVLLEDLCECWGISMFYIMYDLLSVCFVMENIFVFNCGCVVECGEILQVLQYFEDLYMVELFDVVFNLLCI